MIAGRVVMVFDPIFQGLAISLMIGALMSTLLTVVVIPLAYYSYARWRGIGAAARDARRGGEIAVALVNSAGYIARAGDIPRLARGKDF